MSNYKKFSGKSQVITNKFGDEIEKNKKFKSFQRKDKFSSTFFPQAKCPRKRTFCVLCYNRPMNLMKTIFPSFSDNFIKKANTIVKKVNAYEAEVSALSDADFPIKTQELKDKIAAGTPIDSLVPYAFALVREAAKRTLGQRHYDVQIIGGYALHSGHIAEMRTGEGKTLVGTLPIYMNALSGRGVHVVTVNDYLARRDAVWMGQVYAFLGLSIGVINSQNVSYLYDKDHTDQDENRDEVASFKVVYDFLRPISRREAYNQDITYGTNNEFGFDYLRDNLVVSKEQLSQRGHAFAIVDEIDSILIDESRTPLIISNESSESEKLYTDFARIAKLLIKDEDYKIDEKQHSIEITDMGITKAEEMLGIENIYTERGIKYVHHLEIAIKAQSLYHKDKEYVVTDNEVIIVDSFTGRLQPGRRWSEGIHQAIEAKEGVTIQKETKSVASITFQNYFRFYTKLAGMTGTAETSKEEFLKVYGLEVVTVPTHNPIQRIDRNDLIFQNEKGKFKAIAKKVKELQDKGQPVLIGTVSIEKNELLSAYLSSEGVAHTVLNAKNHEKEGTIIADAGRKGSVVIATNMAGRGVDIKLGGSHATEAETAEIKNIGGLFVLGTERHEARRIDNQLRGRAGRQGDPGETQFYVSLEDDLMRIFGPDRIKGIMNRLGVPEDEPIQNKMISRGLENAQEKIEGFHFDSRKYTLEYDSVMNHQRETVYARRRKMVEAEKSHIVDYLNEFIDDDADLRTLIDERMTLVGEDAFIESFRRIVLHVTDILWVEHLETMDYLKSSVNLRAYGQREPLIEYKKEGLQLFKMMEISFREQVINFIKTMNTEARVASVQPMDDIGEHYVGTHEEIGAFGIENTADMEPKKSAIEAKDAKGHDIGRNDPCYCGSGKKFKKCHGV
jgi:preprotein translocase subunit SecA